jgi:hypothetical protein
MVSTKPAAGQKEVQQTASLIRKNENVVLAAIEKIRQAAHGKSKDEYRAIMDMHG